MKKALIALAALAALAVVVRPPVADAIGICDPQRSALCKGLSEVWNFDEATTDGIRTGAQGDRLLVEPAGVDVSYAAGKSSNAAVFTGANALWAPRSGSLGSYATIAMWVKQTSHSGDQVLLTTEAYGATGGTTTSVIHYTAPTSGSPGGWTVSGDANPATCVLTAGDSKAIYVLDDSVHDATFYTPATAELAAIPTGAKITSITVYGTAKRSPSATKFKMGVELNSTTTWGPDSTNLTAAYATYNSGVIARPTGGSWSRADLTSMKVHVSPVASAGAVTVTVDELYASVVWSTRASYEPGITMFLSDVNGYASLSGVVSETDTPFTLTGPAVGTGAWHLVTYTMSPFGDYGKNQVCASVDAGTPTCTSPGYAIRQNGSSDLFIGAYSDYSNGFIGSIDGLLFASRPWSTNDTTTYYGASGAGVVFPFY